MVDFNSKKRKGKKMHSIISGYYMYLNSKVGKRLQQNSKWEADNIITTQIYISHVRLPS